MSNLPNNKDGNISNEVIRQVEREMDIDELQFRQLLPKDDQKDQL